MPPSKTTEPTDRSPSLGELVQRATADMSTLMRQEVALAKAEITQEVTSAAKGAGLFGGAGAAGLLAVVFLSAGAAFGIGEALSPWAGFVIVGAVYLLAAAVLALSGKKKVSEVGAPAHTVATVKDDVAFAKHPTQHPTQKTPAAVP